MCVFPNNTINKLAGLFFTLSLCCRASSREAVNFNFLVAVVIRLAIKPESSTQEADVQFSRPTERLPKS